MAGGGRGRTRPCGPSPGARSCGRRPSGSGARSRRSWPSSLREHEDELAGLEITTCLRDGELEIVTRFAPEAQPAYDRLAARCSPATFAGTLFSTGPTLDELVARGFADRGLHRRDRRSPAPAGCWPRG